MESQLALFGKEKKLQQRFDEFDRDNPHLYVLFKTYVVDALRAGRKKIGAKAIMERIRWYVEIEKGEGEEFRVNNNYTSRYVRKIILEHPELDGFFETRELKA